MEKKIVVLTFMTFLSIVLLLGVVSAIGFTDSVSTITLSQNKISQNFTLITNGNATFGNLPNQQILWDSSGHEIKLDFTEISLTNTSREYNVVASGDLDNFNFPESVSKPVEFTAINATNASDFVSKNISFIFSSDYCGTTLNKGNLNTYIDEIQVLEGYGDDENYWYPLDEIEVKVQIENNGDWDVKNIELRWALYTTNGRKIMDGRERDFRLRYGDDKTITFTFDLDRNIDDFEGEDAVLYVEAKGEIDDGDSVYDGNDTCDSNSEGIDVITNVDFAVIHNLKLNDLEAYGLYNETLSCGQDITFSGELWNIGDSDQNDLILEIYNKDLGLLERISFDEIRAFDSEDFSYRFVIPKDAEEKSYYISLEVIDEYGDVYENDEGRASEKMFAVKVDHCAITEPVITAVLSSEAKEGDEMKINVTITNLDSDKVTFNVGVDEYSSWAQLKSVDPQVVMLDSGQSGVVQLTFDLNKNSEGDHIFKIIAGNGENIVESQAVMVTVTKGSFKLGDFFNSFDWKLGLIILINLLLIIAIVVVAIRLKKK